MYPFLADVVLLLHFGVVFFIVGGLVLIIVGNRLRWEWVNDWWFRLVHLGAIAFVVVQTWLGQLCPLTTLESRLRVQAGSTGYKQSFIEYWLQRLIYYDVPAWVFALAYTTFGLIVLAAWWWFPPQRRTVRDRSVP